MDEEEKQREAAADNGDCLMKIFNNIDWNSRIKPTTNRSWNLSKHDFESSFAYKYLWYKMEPEQIDFNNPFHIEEGNPIRPKLPMKKKKGKKEVTLNMLTEGMRAINDQIGEEEKGEGDNEDFVDEYGNILPDELKGSHSAKKSEKPNKKEKPATDKQKIVLQPESPSASADKKNLRQRFKAKEFHDDDVEPDDNSRGAGRDGDQHRNGGGGGHGGRKNGGDKRKFGQWNDLDGDMSINEGDRKKKKLFEFKSVDFEFPRLSTLNFKAQQRFLQLQKYYRNGTLAPGLEAEYLDLLADVQEERAEFSKFAYEMCEEKREMYDFILPGLDKYVTEHRDHRKERVKQYPRKWKMMKEVRLGAARKEQGDMDQFYLEFVDTILEKGTIPLAHVQKPSTLVMLPHSHQRLVHAYPSDPKIMPGTQGMSRGLERQLKRGGGADNFELPLTGPETIPENKFIHKTSIIQDPNAAKLAGLYVPDVIISASAIKCIMDNFFPHYNRSWEIPVFVQEFDSKDETSTSGKQPRKVIFVGKPFISKQVTACDKNKLAFKYSIRTFLNKEWNTQGKGKIEKDGRDGGCDGERKEQKPDMKKNVPLPVIEEDELFNASLDDLESFGGIPTAAPPPPSSRLPPTSHSTKRPNDDVDQPTVSSVDKKLKDDQVTEETITEEGGSTKNTGGMSQLDGSISAQSFTDMVLDKVDLQDILADPGNIVFNPEDIDNLDLSNLEEEAAKDLAAIDCQDTISPQDQTVSPDDTAKKPTVFPQLDGIISPDLAIIESGLVSHDASGEDDDASDAAMHARVTVLSQLDGAVSSDEEDELMIDLGDSHTPAGGNKDSSQQHEPKEAESTKRTRTRSRSSKGSASVPPVKKEDEEKTPQPESIGRRSTRLRAAQKPADPPAVIDAPSCVTQEKKKRGRGVKKGGNKIVEVWQTSDKKGDKQDETKSQVNKNDDSHEIGEPVKDESQESKGAANVTSKKQETKNDDKDTDKKLEVENEVTNKESIKEMNASNKTDAPASDNKKMTGASAAPKESKSKPSVKSVDKPAVSSSATDFLDTLLSGQSALLGGGVGPSANKQQQQASQHKKEKIGYKGEYMDIGAPCLGPLDQYRPPLTGNNYSYRLWNLWNKNSANSNLRIIIRSKIPGLSPYIGPVVPSVKLEYQTSLGAEQCAMSELCREWADNILRPSSTTLRYRIDPGNGQVLMTQKLKLNNIRQEGLVDHGADSKGNNPRFDPSIQLANLHNLMSELRSLTAGTYLVAHDKKSGPFCRLYAAGQNGEGDYDLHTSYANLKGSDTLPHPIIPWKPIDFDLVTPWHVKNSRVPGTFEPPRKKKIPFLDN